MTKKDIALTVGGILATIAVAYILWKHSASSSTSDANAIDPNAVTYADPSVYAAQYYSSPTTDTTATSTSTPSTTTSSTQSLIATLLEGLLAPSNSQNSKPTSGSNFDAPTPTPVTIDNRPQPVGGGNSGDGHFVGIGNIPSLGNSVVSSSPGNSTGITSPIPVHPIATGGGGGYAVPLKVAM